MAQADDDDIEDSNPKAAKLQADAEKKASKFDWFGANKEKNKEDAAELFIKAAAQWKITKDFKKAGDCFKRAAECCMAAENAIEANNYWKEAGKCYRHINSKLAIDAYNNAINYFKENDKFSQAAKLMEEIGDMLYEDGKLEEAIEQYENCADLFEGDNDQTNANKRWVIVADVCAQLKKYERAIQLYEKTALFNMDNNLLRWNAKMFLFKAMICQLNNCVDRDDPKVWFHIESTLNRYRDTNDLFAQSREYQLCAGLVASITKCDLESFEKAVTAYDKIVKLDDWGHAQTATLRQYIIAKQHAAPVLDEAPSDPKEMEDNNAPEDNAKGENPFDAEQKDDKDFETAPNLL